MSSSTAGSATAPCAPPSPSSRSSRSEVALVAALFLVAIWFPSIDARDGGATAPRVALLIATGLAGAAGGALVLRSWWLSREGPLVHLGLGPAGFVATLREALPLTALALALLVGGVVLLGGDLEPFVPRRVAREVVRYPAWGCVQQLLVLGYVHRRLGPSRAATVGAAAFFAAMHLPNAPLVAGTLVLGLIWGRAWSRHGNVLAIALCHGLAGVVADEVVDMDLQVGLRYWEKMAIR